MNNTVYGLTGSIASGKSTISEVLKKDGFNIVDADEISRNCTKKGNIGLIKIKETFGEDVIDENGDLDRKKLSNIVFSSKDKLDLLNSILHPIIIDEILSQINYFKENSSSPIILDAPLLFETGLDKFCDNVILVYVNENVQIERLILRDNITKEKAEKIISKQMSVEEKKSLSQILIDNSYSLEQLYENIYNLEQKIK